MQRLCLYAVRALRTRKPSRLYSKYQFKEPKTFYYPDRTAETERKSGVINEQTQRQQLEPSCKPRDFYYKVLGVGKYASSKEIRNAYLMLAKRYHPDKMRSEKSLKHFQDISNAYHILTDDNKRLEYDQLGGVSDEQAFLEMATVNPTILGQKLNEAKKLQAETDASDEIDKLMRAKGKNCELELKLSFEEAANGCKKRLDVHYLRKCAKCGGKSQLMTHRDVGKEPCRRCNGSGQLTRRTVTFTSAKTCEQCQGKGYINRRDCEPCGNRGFVLSSVEVLVKVPPGSKDGEVMTIQNPNTNERINYRLVVERSVYFRRDGLNVYSDKLLTISQAILGGTFTVPGLHEPVELRVAPGTQPNTQITIKSRGIRSEQGVGNHIVTLKVFIPTKLSMKQRLLFLGLAQAEDPIFERQTASSYRNSEL
ncbi:protein tumorous imaginal discs, mitochondrial-like isoform X1 [Drosophila guanche]|uniref:protein tumorous imaginal discs, mitochondrial-like isoform X1 n=1 Tax=Drosophila guanche TaxID=7266 RepID=UPI001471CDC0|nr:protein tumorous imaginal discs, mitochondrial-like isoform X1 [Drosophila guanche]